MTGCQSNSGVRESSLALPAAASTSAPDQSDAQQAAQSDPERAFSTGDIEFLAAMLPHHLLAQQMVEQAEQRASSPEVRGFASTLRAAQSPEIDQMTALLLSLGVDPADAGGGHDHGGSGPTQQDVDELGKLTGPAFDKKFVDLLAAHSVTASELSSTEAKTGFNKRLRELAEEINKREWLDLQTLRHLA